MTALLVIGWLVLGVVGGYLTVSGVFLCLVEAVWSGRGRVQPVLLIPSALGLALLALAWRWAPFHVSFAWGH